MLRTIIVLTLFLLAFGLSGQAIYESSAYQQCSAEAGGQNSAEHKWQEKVVSFVSRSRIVFHCAERSIADNNPVVSAIATVVIAVFTTILGLFTMSLARSTRIAADAAKDSANVAKDSLVISNRPRIVPRLELCESSDPTMGPQIRFSIRNRGKVAIVSRVNVTAQTIRGGIQLGKTFSHVPITIDSEIEAGQKLGGYQFTLDYLGVPNLLQGIKSGEITLKIIFQIISKDMFGKDYRPTISFDFDHREGVFAPSKLLKPENK
jgi:hypothetical protein